jgi:hypothetical protein
MRILTTIKLCALLYSKITHLRFAWRTSILYLKLRKAFHGSYIKMKQKMTPLVLKALAKM